VRSDEFSVTVNVYRILSAMARYFQFTVPTRAMLLETGMLSGSSFEPILTEYLLPSGTCTRLSHATLPSLLADDIKAKSP
jgi:hypothetical protein